MLVNDCHCRYEVLQCGDIEKLIIKRQTPDERPVYYVSIEDTFDVIAHIATGHGGRDRMTKHLADKYANITGMPLSSSSLTVQYARKKPNVQLRQVSSFAPF